MWAASALCKAGEGKHPSPGEGPKVPRTVAPRCRLRMDSHMPNPPTCLQDVCMEQLYPPLPCATVRCYCGAATSHDLSTTPKVALMVNVPPHAQSSHSSEGTAQASLDHNEALEDDFQTQHTPVCHVMQWEDTGH